MRPSPVLHPTRMRPRKPYLAGLEENIDGDDGGYVVPQQQDEAERARERRKGSAAPRLGV